MYQNEAPYKWSSLSKKRNVKPCLRYYGPFQVEELISAVAYRITFPSSLPCWQVKEGNPVYLHGITTTCRSHGHWELQSSIKDIVNLHYNEGDMVEVLVKSKWTPGCGNSWKDVDKLQQLFPDFSLRTRCKSKGGVLIGGLW